MDVTDDRPERRLILYMSMSLDGFAARSDGSMPWLGSARPYGFQRQRAVQELLGQTGLIVLGGNAYEDMAAAWPTGESPTAGYMNSLPKLVFSSSRSNATWNNTRITATPVQVEMPALKREPGNDIVVFGGVSFARSLAALRLIDEYRITVQPFALGDGLPLLHGLPEPIELDLISSTTYADGPITHVYASERNDVQNDPLHVDLA
jgi:dihydrofolate reductase